MSEIHEDPAGPQWAMQIVVRREKNAVPYLEDVLSAVAKGVVEIISSTDPEVVAKVNRWTDGKIRKLVKRARGAEWDAVQDIPGVTTSYGDAEVRVMIPGPVDETPSSIRKLQGQGTEFPLRGDDPEWGQVLVLGNPTLDPPMSGGKLCAQVGHAAQLTWYKMSEAEREDWKSGGCSLVFAYPAKAEWDKDLRAAQLTVQDAGFTEVDPGTTTVCAIW